MFSFSYNLLCWTNAGSYPVAGLLRDSRTRYACGTVREWDSDQRVRESRGTPTQAWVAGLCGSGTDLCGTGREGEIFSPAQGSKPYMYVVLYVLYPAVYRFMSWAEHTNSDLSFFFHRNSFAVQVRMPQNLAAPTKMAVQ